MIARTVVGVVFALLLLYILLQNRTALASVQLFGYSFYETTVAWVILASAGAGLAVGLLLGAIGELTARIALWRKEREIRELEQELEAIRELIIEDDE